MYIYSLYVIFLTLMNNIILHGSMLFKGKQGNNEWEWFSRFLYKRYVL